MEARWSGTNDDPYGADRFTVARQQAAQAAADKRKERDMNTTTNNRPGFDSMDEARAANAAIGNHWFSPDTLRFFQARIGAALYDRRFFGHSVRYGDTGPRFHRVAVMRDNGEVEQIDHDFTSAASRDRFLHREARTVEIRFSPWDADKVEADTDPDTYNWQVFVDNLPLGYRTTRADCQALADEIAAGMKA